MEINRDESNEFYNKNREVITAKTRERYHKKKVKAEQEKR
jgi:hypothetical protein